MEQFNYTYSAKQQEEVKRIREKYVVQEVRLQLVHGQVS